MFYLFLSTRVLHILCAALWIGATVLLSFFLGPAVEDAGPTSGKVMAGMNARGFMKFMPSIGGLTVLSGFYLFYHAMHGNPEFMRSLEGKVFGAGALLGITAMIIGASVVGRSAAKLSELGPKAAAMPPGAEQKALQAQIHALQHRVSTFGKIVSFLLVATLVLMSIGHYV